MAHHLNLDSCRRLHLAKGNVGETFHIHLAATKTRSCTLTALKISVNTGWRTKSAVVVAMCAQIAFQWVQPVRPRRPLSAKWFPSRNPSRHLCRFPRLRHVQAARLLLLCCIALHCSLQGSAVVAFVLAKEKWEQLAPCDGKRQESRPS